MSLIKIGALNENTPCFKDFPIYLKGIDNVQKNQLNTTIAYTYIDFELKGTKYETMFHVIPNDFPIEFDGILGNDILKNLSASIDFEKDILHFIYDGELIINHIETPNSPPENPSVANRAGDMQGNKNIMIKSCDIPKELSDYYNPLEDSDFELFLEDNRDNVNSACYFSNSLQVSNLKDNFEKGLQIPVEVDISAKSSTVLGSSNNDCINILNTRDDLNEFNVKSSTVLGPSNNDYVNFSNTRDCIHFGEKSTVLDPPIIKEVFASDDQDIDFCLKELFDYLPFNPSKDSDSLGKICTTSVDTNRKASQNLSENKKCFASINRVTLKPRCEQIVQFDVSIFDSKIGILKRTEIANGVFIADSLVKVHGNKVISSILNINDKEIKLKSIRVEIHPIIDNFPSDVKTILSCNHKRNDNPQRLQKIREKLRTSHLNKVERESLEQICIDFNHVFYLDGDNLTATDALKHNIPTKIDASPINVKSYRYPQIHKEEVDKQINKMLEQNIIEPSTSPWNSPVWVVPKKVDASGERKWRLVIDYRKLNEITIGDSFPLPNITDILDQLGHSKYFTTLDLTSGFHQIEMDPVDAEKTAFSVPSGHYQYTRMPFGLKNAPATFQRLMNTVLAGIQNYRCFVYLDDIVIHADSLHEHNRRLKEVFERLDKFNLKIQPDKCEFMHKQVMYLGHLITNEGIKPDPRKIEVLNNYPVPKNQKDIKAFLGFVGYYRRFIKDFAKIARPLTMLLKKDTEFNWTSSQQESFTYLKNALKSEPILQYPDFSEEFILTTDASAYAIGSVLSQGTPPNDLPIAYASRSLNHAESNYSTTERELLAIVWSIKHFRPYLYGRKFKIYTDHRPLQWLFNAKDPSSRLVRWRLLLEDYDFEIIYKEGRLNNNADALSRIRTFQNSTQTYENFLKEFEKKIILNDNIQEVNGNIFDKIDANICIPISCDLGYDSSLQEHFNEINNKFNHFKDFKSRDVDVDNIVIKSHNDHFVYYMCSKQHYWDQADYRNYFETLTKVREHLLKSKRGECTLKIPKLGDSYDKLSWRKLRSIIRYIFRNTKINVIIFHNDQVCPDENQIMEILKENHSSLVGGHSGFHKTYKRIKTKYKWPNMKSDIKKYIKSCESCQKNKLVRKKTKLPMELTTTSSTPFEKISVDIVGPLPLTENGNRFILTLQDDLTKFSQAYPIPNHESKTIANIIVTEFICKFGIPKSILSDQGPDFTSALMKDIAKLFRIKQINCSAYHPQSNGALERSHCTLADYLKHFVNDKQTDWDRWVDFAMFSYNTSVHTSTKYMPFELLFGIKPNIPASLTAKPEFKYTYDDYVSELKVKLQKSHEIAKNHIGKSKEMNKKYYDRKHNLVTFKIGEKVYLLNETHSKGKSKKLRPHYEGPYEIIEVNSNCNSTILVKNKKKLVHNNRLKLAHN